MASLIFRVDGHEVARRRLNRRLVIGRSAACDISIRDPLLSRQHCQIEFDGVQWVLTDLQSLNGTWLNDHRVQRQNLSSGDHIRIGIVCIFFNTRELDEPRRRLRRFIKKHRRPAEPPRRFPLLADRRLSVERSVSDPVRDFPAPRPKPTDPLAYRRENLYLLFAQIAASSHAEEPTLPARRRSQPQPMPRPRSRELRQPRGGSPMPFPNVRWKKMGRWTSWSMAGAVRLLVLSALLFSLASRIRK